MTWTMVLPVWQMWYTMFSVIMQQERGQWEEKLMDKAEQQEDNQVTLRAKPLTLFVTKCCPVLCLTYTLKLHLFIAIHKYYDCYIVVCMVITDVIVCYFCFYF